MAQNPDPTPEEIAAACLEIQRGWTAEEKLKRLRADLRPTYTRCDGETEAMTAANYDGHHRARGELQTAGTSTGPVPGVQSIATIKTAIPCTHSLSRRGEYRG
jgi:hypothetical protein